MQVVQESGSRQILQGDSLMPLVEQEYNSLSRPLSKISTPQMCNLPSISSRAAQHAPAQAFTWYVPDFSQPCKSFSTIVPVQDIPMSHILSCHVSSPHFPTVARVFKLSQHDARVIRHSAGFIQPFLLQGDPSIVARPAGHPRVYNPWLMA